MTEKSDNKVTIYTTSSGFGFGINKTEAKLVDHGTRKYAQYNAVPFATFVPKRKRKARQYLAGFKPYLLILKGWDHPEPSDGFNAPEANEASGLVTQSSTYTSCDDRYATDFDAKVNAYIAAGSAEVVADYRFTNDPDAELYTGPINRSAKEAV